MTRSDVRGSNNNEQGFYGRDLLYRVRSGNLDREANDGTDRYVEKNSKPILVTLGSIFAVAIVALAISGLVGMSLQWIMFRISRRSTMTRCFCRTRIW